MSALRDRAMALLPARAARLMKHLARPETPAVIIAMECELIGACAVLLDPHGTSERAADRAVRAVKAELCLCMYPECELPGCLSSQGIYCESHAAAVAEEIALINSGGEAS